LGISLALSTRAVVAFADAEIGCDLRELVQGGLQVLDNFGCQLRNRSDSLRWWRFSGL
jgi:hypothetical protein